VSSVSSTTKSVINYKHLVVEMNWNSNSTTMDLMVAKNNFIIREINVLKMDPDLYFSFI